MGKTENSQLHSQEIDLLFNRIKPYLINPKYIYQRLIMELPHVGLRCTKPDCNQLDFLPIKCDACKNIFCAEHYKYESHQCTDAKKRNKLVPTCCHCQALVPLKGLSEEEAMRLHISNGCTPYKKTKIYKNRCAQRECKQKELTPMRCDECNLDFCIKHRHSQDHNCKGRPPMRELCGKAAEDRLRKLTLKEEPDTKKEYSMMSCAAEEKSIEHGKFPSRIMRDGVQATNANLSEEEALALAIAKSEAEARKREEENRKRLVDATAS